VLGLLVVAALVIGGILVFGGDSTKGGGGSAPTTAPEIPVGPSGGQPSAPKPPPTSISIKSSA
jgi:serine/threonine-protein kinase